MSRHCIFFIVLLALLSLAAALPLAAAASAEEGLLDQRELLEGGPTPESFAAFEEHHRAQQHARRHQEEEDHSPAVVEAHAFDCEVCVALCGELDGCVRTTAQDHSTEEIVRCAIDNLTSLYTWDAQRHKLRRHEPLPHERADHDADGHIPHYVKDPKRRPRLDVDGEDEELLALIPAERRAELEAAGELQKELLRLRSASRAALQRVRERHLADHRARVKHAETSERVETVVRMHVDRYAHDVVLHALASAGKLRRRMSVPPTVCIEELCGEHLHLCTLGSPQVGHIFHELRERRRTEAEDRRRRVRDARTAKGADDSPPAPEDPPEEEDAESFDDDSSSGSLEALKREQTRQHGGDENHHLHANRASVVHARGPPHHRFREHLGHFVRHLENHHGTDRRSTMQANHPHTRLARHQHMHQKQPHQANADPHHHHPAMRPEEIAEHVRTRVAEATRVVDADRPSDL